MRAPKLVVYEVGNTLWKAVKQGFINPDEAMQKFSYFLELRIDSIEPDEEEHKEATKNSGLMGIGHSSIFSKYSLSS